ncbi:hypothetical protein ACIPYS_21495 [Kitasatospora sp. NPDC089913]|uniref:hypothetical protein n=1 Tax=Kitasatospora sp. NPDC089913 TaxID=3364080 RepID=UPI00381158A8
MGPTSDEEWTVSVGAGLLPPTTLTPAAALTEIWQTVRDVELVTVLGCNGVDRTPRPAGGGAPR